MRLIALIMLLMAVPIILSMFAVWPARRAVIGGYLFCAMFLPMKAFVPIPVFPNYDKFTAGSLAVLLGVAIFDSKNLLAFKPRWFDLPMLAWLIGPIITAVNNDIGGSVGSAIYGGLTMSLAHLFKWGLPYYFGRVYFRNLDHLKELAIAIFVGGLIYVPLCLYEIRFSPQLHYILYGYYQHAFDQTMRLGGFRPMVFMQHGLMVGFFMTAATLIGLALWRMGGVKQIRGMPMSLLVPVLAGTTVLCKSSGAMLLLMMGVGTLWMMKWTKMKVWLAALLLIAPMYIATRMSGIWTGEQLVEMAEDFFGEERAGSLAGRLRNEDMFIEKARERMAWGWSGWDRFQVYSEYGRRMTTPDGLWVISLGMFGLVGLTALVVLLQLPGYLAWRWYPPPLMTSPTLIPVTALAIVLVLWMIDCLLNGMINAAYIVAAGALPGAMPRMAVKKRPVPRPVAGRQAGPAGHPPAAVGPRPAGPPVRALR